MLRIANVFRVYDDDRTITGVKYDGINLVGVPTPVCELGGPDCVIASFDLFPESFKDTGLK
jgi:hypothetical protein